MRLCELKQKEIINTCTCKSLGCPIDIDFNCKTGQILALIVPGPGRICSLLGRDSEFIIPWECICQIGEDIILVEIKEDKCLHKT
ncbi:MAG TPA: YlmC/YmxH family sporulation protein [Candidatus Blautia gallistercoris]|uniref:YlmC/YmxH family sporulation protein n=1 Tax=Candidatus Blautia gallistercoris TaxID=2838490 RepID=A0A9D1WI53_9FIRM|nr:YlmC/YmxH family sporulation protein [Candidatus Blautia gallistercoris]